MVKRVNVLMIIISIIGLMMINSCSTTQGIQKSGNPANSDLEQLLAKAKKGQEKLAFYGNAYNEDNTFSLVDHNGEYNLVLPLKDCFLDTKCGPTCDPTVKTGHSGDHLWLYLQKKGIPYTLDRSDWNKTMISVVEGLISKGIPVTYKASTSK